MKNKRKVIDMHTKNDMEATTQDTARNDAHAMEVSSHYLGVLPKATADHVRTSGQQLAARQAQLNAMAAQWEQDYKAHLGRLHAVLVGMSMVPAELDLAKHSVFIDKDGHVFLRKLSDILH